MFYSQIILAKKSPLGKIWLAAHWEKKLSKTQIFQTNITTTVDFIVNPTVPLALRVSGHLLLGLVRIYSRKVRYLMTDCTEALTKIKLAFRPGVVDLPAGASEAPAAAINVAGFGDFADIDLADPFAIDAAGPDADEWLAATSATVARRQDITLSDHESTSMLAGAADGGGSFFVGFDDGDSWMTLGGGGAGAGGASAARSRSSRVSDVEAARHADGGSGASVRARMSIDASVGRDRSLSLGGAGGALDDLGPATLPADLDADIALPPDELEFPPYEAELGALPQDDFDMALPGAVRLDESGAEGDRAAALEEAMEVEAPEGHEGEAAAAAAAGVEEEKDEEEEPAAAAAAAALEAGEEEEVEAPGKAKKKRAMAAKARKRRARKRKLELDSVMEIDSATMKRQLLDSSDIVRKRTPLITLAYPPHRTAEELLAAPLLPGLAPELVELWDWTRDPAPLPFPMPRLRVAGEAEQEAVEEREKDAGGATVAAGNGHPQEEPEEDVEVVRRGRRSESLLPADRNEGAAAAAAELQEDMAFEAPVGDLGMPDFEPPAFDVELPELPVVEDAADAAAAAAAEPEMDVGEPGDFALGGIDDIPRDEDPSAAAAAAAADSAAAAAGGGPPPQRQWHPQTVKVMQVVARKLNEEDAVTFKRLARGAKRRQAAGCFFELLQLKTWDCVQLSQDTPYGDITISRGPQMNEGAAT